MANANLLNLMAEGGGQRPTDQFSTAAVRGEQIASSQQNRNQNALLFRQQQQQMAQQQSPLFKDAQGAAAAYLMAAPEQRQTAWQQGVAQLKAKYPGDPSLQSLTGQETEQQALGIIASSGFIPKEVMQKVVETRFSPQKYGSPVAAVGPDGKPTFIQAPESGGGPPVQVDGYAPPTKPADTNQPPVTVATVLIDGVPTVVDARTYRPGSKAGVIGPGIKEGDAQKRENTRAFGMQGINDSLNTAEDILRGVVKDANGNIIANTTKPTSSGIGTVVDAAATSIGLAPPGSEQADQLRSIGGSLVSKVPRMQGPQSDKDVALYKQMAGDIGNSSLPISRRLAAIQTVRQLYAKYEHLNTGATNLPSGWKVTVHQ